VVGIFNSDKDVDSNPTKGFEPPQKGGRVRRLHFVQFCKVGGTPILRLRNAVARFDNE